MTIEIHTRPDSTVSATLVDRWRKIPVAVVVDLDKSVRQIDPLIQTLLPAAGHPTVIGQALTARCAAPDFGAVVQVLDALQQGDVLVIAADGHPDHAMIGDVLSGHLRSKGVVSVVCDGAVRDTAILSAWTDFPVYSRSKTPRGPTGKEQGVINGTVSLGGVLVAPGDWILGDADGLAVLSVEELERWIDPAEARLVQEEQWIKQLADGTSAASVFGI